MSSPYTQQVLKVIVAQVCQTIGWNSIQTTPLELLGDILHKYLQEVSHQTHRYSELYGRSEPNLDDVALAFRDMNIITADLEDYITNVDPVPCAIDVPKYPHQRENHLNFLKPGCKEVVTRPVHVHEHLPPMYPEKEEEEVPVSDKSESHEDQNGNCTPTIRDEKDAFLSPEASEASRLRTLSETEVRLTREITSVMMTTSGFISPAREGKLPDSKAPFIQSFEYPKPQPKEPIIIPPLVPITPVADNPEKSNKKKKLSADKKDKFAKDLFKSKVAPMGPPPPKQMPPMAAIIFPPSDSPMAAVVEQQQQQSQQKRKSSSKERKHKQKDPNKALNKSGEGKTSKKKRKQNEVIAKIEKPWNDTNAMSGIAPLVPNYAMPQYDATHIKTERPITPDIPKSLLLPDPQLPPFLNLPAGTTGTFTHGGQSPNLSLINAAATHNQYEGKIDSEPDKRKMNIFKRISSSKNKDELVKSMLPHNLNLPETSIFPIDDTPILPNIPGLKKTASPRKPNFAPFPNDQPLNMSMPKTLDPMQSFDLTTSPTNSPFGSPSHFIPMAIGKHKKEPKPKKVREKKPPKIREKKIKGAANLNWPKNTLPDGLPASLVPPPMQILSPQPKSVAPKKIVGHLPPTLGNIDDEYGQLMGPVPWFPGGTPGLIPMAPMSSVPGLIPNAEFFSRFPMHGPPFGGPASMNHIPSFGLPNPIMRPDYPLLKRVRADDDYTNTPIAPSEIEKVKCNVAPLVPESLNLGDDLQRIHSPPHKVHKSRPMPSNDPLPPPPMRQPSPVKQRPTEPPMMVHHDSPLPTTSSSYKRRRSTMSPPKTPVIIDLDVQSISDDELPDDMDLDDLSPDNTSPLPDPPRSEPIVATPPSGADKKDKSAAKLEKRREKEHRKKDKEGKIKKKKDKKNKSKGLDKSEKRKGKEEKKRDKETKDRLKKEKREKKREKERLATLAAANGGLSDGRPDAVPLEGATRHAFGETAGTSGHHQHHADGEMAGAVPKLTLKLGQSPRPHTPDVGRKITIKPPKKDRHAEITSDSVLDAQHHHVHNSAREQSPELARFSALVTRPPKQKTPSTNEPTTQRGNEFGSTLHTYHFSPVNHNSDSNNDEFHSGDERRDPALLSRRLRRSPSPFAHQGQPFPNAPTTLSPPLSRGSVGSRSSNSQHHHNQHHKHHRHGGDHSPSSHYAQRPRTPSPTPYANSSRPAHSHTSNAPARAFDASGSGLQPAPQPPPPLQGVAQASRQSSYIDSDGNQVWICPACGRIDDGTPMIGCDGCDAWYHWVCVGIQVPPDTNEDWYCRVCIAKKQEQAGSDKKKKRKKKDKKDH